MSELSPAERYAVSRVAASHPVVEEFRVSRDFDLDPFQIEACQRVEEGQSVLVAAPTGAGKTSSLYALLREIDPKARNVCTLEDPVEVELPEITQGQVNRRAGFDFASGLRAVLRQDPDVILVGEMRDHETAAIAVQASLTGHLVLSTLHTNSVPATITRLLDLGLEPYVVASALSAVVAQRLVRTLCPACMGRLPRARHEAQLAEAQLAEAQLAGDHAQPEQEG